MSIAIEKLQARVELLKAEHGKGVTNINLLKEQLAKSEAHLHMVTGHMNEANFQLQEAVSEEAALQAGSVPQAEIADGEAHVQSPE